MSISSNLTEREGKKERKRRTERERENGRSLGFSVFSWEVFSLKQGEKKRKRNKRTRKW